MAKTTGHIDLISPNRLDREQSLKPLLEYIDVIPQRITSEH